MQLERFLQSIKNNRLPEHISVHLQAMWHDARGDWNKAHELIGDLEDTTACWLHAYLHRKEGDLWNADYWYRKAGKNRPSASLQQEWENIIHTLL